MFDYLIVGAGFAGSTLAERLASQLSKKVLLVDKRMHIGGNADDHYDDAGVLVHKYGPHIFHINARMVFDYLSKFTKWCAYQHRVLASVDGQLVFYRQYQALAEKTPGVHFAGRLATYKYYNMDQVVAQALTLFNKIGEKEKSNSRLIYRGGPNGDGELKKGQLKNSVNHLTR